MSGSQAIRLVDGPVLLTGARGQLGHELRRELAALAEVFAPARDELDLADPASIRAAVRRIRPALVINAAAYTAVDRAESEPALCEAINATAPGLLAEEVAAVGGALVHYSTDYVFDGTKASAYVEDDVPNPLNVYGATKLAGERAIAATGAPHLIFRTSWVFAARGHNFMRTMLRLARERETLRVVSDQVGAPTWARFIATTTVLVLTRLREPARAMTQGATAGGIYHLTAGGCTSWHGFATELLRHDPRRSEQRCRVVEAVPTAAYPTPARRPANSCLDNSALLGRFGTRQMPWTEGVSLAISDHEPAA